MAVNVLTLIFLYIFWKLYSVSVTNVQRNINVIIVLAEFTVL